MIDLSGKTFDELRAEFIALGDQFSALAETRRAYADEITKRTKMAAAHAKVDALAPDEKSALAAALAGTDVLQSKPDPVKVP